MNRLWDHRTDAIPCGRDHILQLLLITARNRLESRKSTENIEGAGHFTLRQHANYRHLATERERVLWSGEGAGSAELDRSIDADLAGERLRRLATVAVLDLVDGIVAAHGTQPVRVLGRRGRRDNLGAARLGELKADQRHISGSLRQHSVQ